MQEAQQKPGPSNIPLPTYHDDRDTSLPVASPRRLKGSRRRWLWIGLSIILLIVIAGAGILISLGTNNGSRITYSTAAIQSGNLSLQATATGALTSNVYNLDFPVAGTIADIDVTLGQQVTAGQVLAHLSTATLTDNEKSGATLTAPAAGVITAINGSVGTSTSSIANGNTSSATGSVPNSFIQIVDTSSLQAIVDVSEADMGHLAPGDAVRFTVDAYSTRTFRGTVHASLPMQQDINNVIVFPVVVTLDTTSLQGSSLLPGMTVNASITLTSRSNVLLLPNNAVSFAQHALVEGLISSRQAQDAQMQAKDLLTTYKQNQAAGALQDDPNPTYILQLVNGLPVPKPVLLGITDGSSYEVLAGLNANDSVITSATGATSTPHTPTLGGNGGGK